MAGKTGSALPCAIQILTSPTAENFLSHLLEIISASFTSFQSTVKPESTAPQLQDSWLSNVTQCSWVPPAPSAQMNRQGVQSPASHKRAGNHRAWESQLLHFQLCGMLPRGPQSTRGICQVFGDLQRQPACQGYPRATDLTARQEP